MLVEAYQAAALALSHAGAHISAWVAALSAIISARRAGNRTLAPVLTAACVHRRDNRLVLATELAETVLEGLADTANGPSVEYAIRGAARLELAAVAAQSCDRTTADAHLVAAAEDAKLFAADIELPGGIWFGPTMLAIRQLDLAVRAGDPGLALTIAARLDTASLPAMARARARIYAAAAHSFAGNNRRAARTIAEVTCMAPQLAKDPLVQRLIRSFYPTHAGDRR